MCLECHVLLPRERKALTRSSGGRGYGTAVRLSTTLSNLLASPVPWHGWRRKRTATRHAAGVALGWSLRIVAASSLRPMDCATSIRALGSRWPSSTSNSTSAVALLREVNGLCKRIATPVPRHRFAHRPHIGGQVSAPSQPPHCSTSTRSPSVSARAEATRGCFFKPRWVGPLSIVARAGRRIDEPLSSNDEDLCFSRPRGWSG